MTVCARCNDDRCDDPDSKWCSDIILMRYRALFEKVIQIAEAYEPRCDTCPRGVATAIRALLEPG